MALKQKVKKGRDVARSGRELARPAMNRSKGTSRTPKRIFAVGVGSRANNGAPVKPAATAVFRHPKTQVEAAVQRYIELFNFAPIAYVTFDRVGRIEEMNLAAVRLLHRSRKNSIGNPFALCVANADAQLFLNHLLRCGSSLGRVETELQLRAPDGTIPVQLSSTPTFSAMKDGALLYQTAILDLRERKAAEAEVRAKQAELDLIVTETPFMFTRCSRDLRYRYVSRTYAKMAGRTAEEIAGKPIGDIMGKGGLASIRPYIEKVLSGERADYEALVSFKNGERRFLHGTYLPDRNERGEVIGWIASLLDITERKKAEAVLKDAKAYLETRVQERTRQLIAANEELENKISRRKGLEGEILEISDREQQQLGRELHDGICQHLTAVAFIAHSAAIRLKRAKSHEAGEIEKITRLINEAADDARDIARSLHSVDVGAPELMLALQDLVTRKIWTTPCRLEIKTPLVIHEDVAASHLYRIVREAIINANKHARAHEIIVRIERSEEEMVLSVSDDGAGIRRKGRKTGGMGFHIMNYRARAIGGRLEIELVKPHGTRVACYLPQK